MIQKLYNEDKLNFFLYLSLTFMLISMIVMSFYHGITGDEPEMHEYGKVMYDYFASFGADKTIFSEDPLFDKDKVIKYYGGLFTLLCTILGKIIPADPFVIGHVVNAIFGFIGIYFVARICKLIGNKQIALIAIWIMFLSPFYLGHSMNNPKDVPFAAMYIMAVFFILRFFNTPAEERNRWDYLWVILSIGAGINVRVGGLLLLAYVVAFVGIEFIIKNFIQKEKVSIQSYIKPLLIILPLGYLAGSLVWPFALENPIQNPLKALQEFSQFQLSLGQLWEGEKVRSQDFPSYYLLKTFSITNSFALLLGLLMTVLAVIKNRKNAQYASYIFVAFTFLFPVVYIIFTKANIFHAWRHLTFIFPPAVILAAFGWNSLQAYLQKLKLVVYGLLILLLLDPISYIVTTFPQFVTYHNALVGGIDKAYGNYEVDFYYNGLKESVDYFLDVEYPKYSKTDTVVLMSNAQRIIAYYRNRLQDYPNLKVDYIRYNERNDKRWDYLIMHIALIPQEDIKSGHWLPESTLQVTKVKGHPLAAVIKRPSFDDIKGDSLATAGLIEEAKTAYTNYLIKDPNNTSILNKLASLYLQTNNIPNANELANKSLNLNQDNLETINLLGMISLQKQDFNTAYNMFVKILQANPQYVQAYYYLGIAQQGMGQLNEALSSFNTASQIPQLSAACYKAMADIYSAQGNAEQANRLYQLAGGNAGAQ